MWCWQHTLCNFEFESFKEKKDIIIVEESLQDDKVETHDEEVRKIELRSPEALPGSDEAEVKESCDWEIPFTLSEKHQIPGRRRRKAKQTEIEIDHKTSVNMEQEQQGFRARLEGISLEHPAAQTKSKQRKRAAASIRGEEMEPQPVETDPYTVDSKETLVGKVPKKRRMKLPISESSAALVDPYL